MRGITHSRRRVIVAESLAELDFDESRQVPFKACTADPAHGQALEAPFPSVAALGRAPRARLRPRSRVTGPSISSSSLPMLQKLALLRHRPLAPPAHSLDAENRVRSRVCQRESLSQTNGDATRSST